MKNDQEIFDIIENYINGNRNRAMNEMKELKDSGQEEELMDQLSVYKKEFQIELLSYFYKNS